MSTQRELLLENSDAVNWRTKSLDKVESGVRGGVGQGVEVPLMSLIMGLVI